MCLRAGLIAIVMAAPLAHAQAADLGGPEGAELTREAARPLDAYALPVSRFGQEAPTVALTGAVVRRAWRVPAEGRSVLAVMRIYRRALRAQGYRRLLDCTTDECGGFDFRFGAEMLPPPDMAMDVRDFAQLSVGREDPASYASVLVSRVRDWIFVQIVTIVPGGCRIGAGSPAPGQAC